MAPLFGVRYRTPFEGPLIHVDGPIGAATALSRHADCLTWVVQVEYNHHAQMWFQVGNPLYEHDGRFSAMTPDPPLRPAPPSKHQEERQQQHRDRPHPDTIAALLALDEHGQIPAEPHSRGALLRRGWYVEPANVITDAGRSAAVRLRPAEAAMAGASS